MSRSITPRPMCSAPRTRLAAHSLSSRTSITLALPVSSFRCVSPTLTSRIRAFASSTSFRNAGECFTGLRAPACRSVAEAQHKLPDGQQAPPPPRRRLTSRPRRAPPASCRCDRQADLHAWLRATHPRAHAPSLCLPPSRLLRQPAATWSSANSVCQFLCAHCTAFRLNLHERQARCRYHPSRFLNDVMCAT